jgi:hypothetical protein
MIKNFLGIIFASIFLSGCLVLSETQWVRYAENTYFVEKDLYGTNVVVHVKGAISHNEENDTIYHLTITDKEHETERVVNLYPEEAPCWISPLTSDEVYSKNLTLRLSRHQSIITRVFYGDTLRGKIDSTLFVTNLTR